MIPLFIATKKFDPSDGEKWQKYFQWADIPALEEVVSLDSMLCPHLIKDFLEEDWEHIVNENFRLDYFYHLDYLMKRVSDLPHKNILALYRNPDKHITTAPGDGNFVFAGYDLLDDITQISALTNCGGFPDVFGNSELNRNGLVENFDRALQIKQQLPESYPLEHHARCEMYAIWKLCQSE